MRGKERGGKTGGENEGGREEKRGVGTREGRMREQERKREWWEDERGE